MSDQFYAVQFRNMNTDAQTIAVFSIQTEAEWFFRMVESHAEIPERYIVGERSLVGYQEINADDKPYEAFGLEILYINEWAEFANSIPDVYNYQVKI